MLVIAYQVIRFFTRLRALCIHFTNCICSNNHLFLAINYSNNFINFYYLCRGNKSTSKSNYCNISVQAEDQVSTNNACDDVEIIEIIEVCDEHDIDNTKKQSKTDLCLEESKDKGKDNQQIARNLHLKNVDLIKVREDYVTRSQNDFNLSLSKVSDDSLENIFERNSEMNEINFTDFQTNTVHENEIGRNILTQHDSTGLNYKNACINEKIIEKPNNKSNLNIHDENIIQ